MSILADCTLTTVNKAAACADCLSATEKMALKIRYMSLALQAAGGPDWTNINVLKQNVACFGCVSDFRLDSMEVVIWANLAQNFGARLSQSISENRALIKCVPCGEQKFQRAAFVSLLCQLSNLAIPVSPIIN